MGSARGAGSPVRSNEAPRGVRCTTVRRSARRPWRDTPSASPSRVRGAIKETVKIPSKVDVWRCEGSKGDWDFGWGIPIPAKLFAHIGRPARILIMKNPISFGTLPPSTLPKKRINRTRTDTRVCEKI